MAFGITNDPSIAAGGDYTLASGTPTPNLYDANLMERRRLAWLMKHGGYGDYSAPPSYFQPQGAAPSGPVGMALSAYNSMPSLYQGISGSIGSGLQTVAAVSRAQRIAAGQQQAQAQANAANEQRYNQIGGFNEYMYHGQPINSTGNGPGGKGSKFYHQDTSQAGINDMNAQMAAGSNYAPMAGGYYGLRARQLSDINNDYTQANAGYASRYQRGMSMANSAFLQQRNDINYNMNKTLLGQGANATAQGLGSSTVLSSLQNNVESARARALGGLGDDQARLRMQADASLSGDQLASQERWQKARLGADADTSGDMLKFATARTDLGPQGGPYFQSMQGAGRYYGQQQGMGGYGGGGGYYGSSIYG